MITLQRSVSPSDLKAYIARNSGSGDMRAHFKTQGATGSNLLQLEATWLVAKGGAGSSLNALWGSYLASKGYTVGSLKDRIKAFIKNGTQA